MINDALLVYVSVESAHTLHGKAPQSRQPSSKLDAWSDVAVSFLIELNKQTDLRHPL